MAWPFPSSFFLNLTFGTVNRPLLLLLLLLQLGVDFYVSIYLFLGEGKFRVCLTPPLASLVVSSGSESALAAVKENPDGAIATVTVLGFGKYLPLRFRVLAYAATVGGWSWRYPDALSELAKSGLESVPSKSDNERQ